VTGRKTELERPPAPPEHARSHPRRVAVPNGFDRLVLVEVRQREPDGAKVRARQPEVAHEPGLGAGERVELGAPADEERPRRAGALVGRARLGVQETAIAPRRLEAKRERLRKLVGRRNRDGGVETLLGGVLLGRGSDGGNGDRRLLYGGSGRFGGRGGRGRRGGGGRDRGGKTGGRRGPGRRGGGAPAGLPR